MTLPGSPDTSVRIIGLNRRLDGETRPPPPAPWHWTEEGLLIAPPSPYSGGEPWYPFRLEGTPVVCGVTEWVGHAGRQIDAVEMAEWLVRTAGLYAAVQVVELIHLIEAHP